MPVWPSEMKHTLITYFNGSYAVEIMPSLVTPHTRADVPTERDIKSLFWLSQIATTVRE